MLKFVVSLVLAAMLFPSFIQAGEVGNKVTKGSSWRLLDLDYVGMRYVQVRNLRDPYFPEFDTIEGECTGTKEDGTRSTECWRYGADVLFNINVLQIPKIGQIFWRNDVGMNATTSQVRHVNWHWKAGVDFGKFEFGTEHWSRHCMECNVPPNSHNYPLQDFYYLEFSLYGNKRGL